MKNKKYQTVGTKSNTVTMAVHCFFHPGHYFRIVNSLYNIIIKTMHTNFDFAYIKVKGKVSNTYVIFFQQAYFNREYTIYMYIKNINYYQIYHFRNEQSL